MVKLVSLLVVCYFLLELAIKFADYFLFELAIRLADEEDLREKELNNKGE